MRTTRTLTLAAAAGLLAGPALADSGVFVPIDPTRTFLRTCDDPAGTPTLDNGGVIDLDAWGFAPGDTIRITPTGDFAFVPGGPEDGTRAIAVFSTDGFVDPDVTLANRVPGQVPSDATPFDSTGGPTFCPDEPNSIDYDFECLGDEITVPDRGDGRAAFLIVSALDEFYSDNSDVTTPPFGAELTREHALQELIANSIDDYSGVQGERGWYYGRTTGGTYTGNNFQLFPYFGPVRYPNGFVGQDVWSASSQPGNYISINQSQNLPGPLNSSQTAVDTIRRYVVERSTTLRMSGFFDKFQGSDCGGVGGPLNDGVRCSIWINGQQIWSATTTVPAVMNFELWHIATTGDIIDFVVNRRVTGNCDNTTVDASLFSVSPCNAADVAVPLRLLDLSDVNAFTAGFVAMDPIADLNADGLFDLSDINLFITSFTAGCP